MQHLFEDWPHLSQVFKAAGQILLLADFDGTLAPIAARPELAGMSGRMKSLLSRLAKNSHFTAGILSGRSLSNLKGKVDVKGLIYAGNHGLEIETLNETYIHPKAIEASKLIRKVKRELITNLSSFEGVFVEDKGLTLSVHYRLAAFKDNIKIKKVFFDTVGPYAEKDLLKQTEGKKVLELRPPIDWNKGSAVLWLIEVLNLKNSLPIYIGDDKTDEDVFKILGREGVSVFIGEASASSKAVYYLRDVSEVEKLFEKIEGLFDK